jgi:hypothetical protein
MTSCFHRVARHPEIRGRSEQIFQILEMDSAAEMFVLRHLRSGQCSGLSGDTESETMLHPHRFSSHLTAKANTARGRLFLVWLSPD